MILKIVSVAVLTAVLCLYLKNVGSDFFLPTLICGGIIISLFAVEELTEVFSFFKTFSDYGVQSETLVLCLKISSIAFIVEFVCGMIEDVGLKGLADKLATFGRLLIICVSLPIFISFMKMVASFLGGG